MNRTDLSRGRCCLLSQIVFVGNPVRVHNERHHARRTIRRRICHNREAFRSLQQNSIVIPMKWFCASAVRFHSGMRRPTGSAPQVHRDRAQSAPPAGRVGHATSWRMAPHLPGLDLVEIDPEAAEETDPALLRALLRRWRRHKPVPLERHSRSSRSPE